MARFVRPKPPSARRAPASVPPGRARSRTLRFQMASRRDAVAPAVERILRAAIPAGLSPGQRDDLAVAVAEALSNAAVHGNRLGTGTKVRVTIAVIPGTRVDVDVADSGPGFDAAAVGDPTEPDRMLMPGGRGVFLMRRLLDELHYNEAGNSVRLTMRTRPPSRE